MQSYDNQRDHRQPEVTNTEYLMTPHFVEATMENWKSEFLQMFLFIMLTAFLYQKGSSESKKLDEEESVDRDPRKSKDKKDAPYPVRRGGLILKIYENSLSLAFLTSLSSPSFCTRPAERANTIRNKWSTEGRNALRCCNTWARRVSDSSRFRTGRASFWRSG